jgi:hypothetical protein
MIALSALLLSGCWFGYGLFADGDARAVLAPGVYRLIEPGKPAHEVKISVLPSGMTQVDDPDSDDGDAVYGFIPLAGGERFLVWVGKFGKPSEQQTQIYFFGDKRADSFAFFVPACGGADGTIAVAAGAVIESGSTPSCRFASKTAVLRALAQVRPNESDTVVLRHVR